MISVIVPVYKVEEYLSRCVDSILAQTYQDFQLILVDDGSPDNCGAICDGYARKDSRIHVIHQKNGGLSAARNAGIDWVFACSDSQWLTFVDSDDWIHPHTLEKLLQAAQQQDAAVSVCGFAETGGENPVVAENMEEAVAWKASDFYVQKFINATVAWGKLYRRECFEALRYPVGKLHEDEFTTYRLLFAQDRIAYVPAPYYAYFVNTAGITKSGWTPRRLHAWEAYEQQITFFEDRGMEDLVKFRYRGYLENAMVNLHAAEEDPDKYKKEIRFIEKRMRSVIRRAWKKGVIDFWIDFDMLYRFSPVMTKIYCFYKEKIRG